MGRAGRRVSERGKPYDRHLQIHTQNAMMISTGLSGLEINNLDAHEGLWKNTFSPAENARDTDRHDSCDSLTSSVVMEAKTRFPEIMVRRKLWRSSFKVDMTTGGSMARCSIRRAVR